MLFYYNLVLIAELCLKFNHIVIAGSINRNLQHNHHHSNIQIPFTNDYPPPQISFTAGYINDGIKRQTIVKTGRINNISGGGGGGDQFITTSSSSAAATVDHHLLDGFDILGGAEHDSSDDDADADADEEDDENGSDEIDVYDEDDSSKGVESGHYSDKTFQMSNNEDYVPEPEYKSHEYDDKQLELQSFGALSGISSGGGVGGSNNNGGGGSGSSISLNLNSGLSGAAQIQGSNDDLTNALPVFLIEPQSTFTVKNRPAVLRCKAAHALQLSFKCSGSSQPPPSIHESHVDPHTGVQLEEVTANISRDLVEEYFGEGPFKCDCHAWSSRGGVKSQAATVTVAYIKKQFAISPTSLRTELGGKIDLFCEPPNGLPHPRIIWHKNGIQIQADSTISISPEGTLHIDMITLQDMSNYTCIAENLAGKRISDPATINIYVNGGWSKWSPWMECKCPGKQIQGKKRTRNCSNPIPFNGGAQCEGPNIQKTSDCIACPEDTQIVSIDSLETTLVAKAGRWSLWSEWSSCTIDCIQIRRRKCINSATSDGLMGGSLSSFGSEGYDKSLCTGKDFQTTECRGGNCRIGRDDFDWLLYAGLTVITSVCLALVVTLIRTARRNRQMAPFMADTVMHLNYLNDPSADKKTTIHFHSGTPNRNYDYPNAPTLTLASTMTRSKSEHHYDVPNLSTNYTNPIDEISTKYSYDTADSSTCTSDSTYDIASEPQSIQIAGRPVLTRLGTTKELVTSSGEFLRLYNDRAMIYIPDMAFSQNIKHTMFLSILTDEFTKLISSKQSTHLSPVMYCGPVGIKLNKPVILKLPHCMTDPNDWQISIYYSESLIQDMHIEWRNIATVGQETINTPIFIQVDAEFIYIMTEQLGRYVVIGEPRLSSSSPPQIDNNYSTTTTTTTSCTITTTKRMKFLIFGQIAPGNLICSLRIYIVADFPNSKDQCMSVEGQLGGNLIGESSIFLFQLNNTDLRIHLNCIGEWESINNSNNQIIPYDHLLNSNSILHCEFSLQRTEQESLGLNLEINYSQNDHMAASNFMIYVPPILLEYPKSPINSVTGNRHKNITTSVDNNGFIYTNIDTTDSRISRHIKKILCTFLDPPREDGNDWRLLAKILNADRYIAYFATKPSPTEQILNLWECRGVQPNANLQLINILTEMKRFDVIDNFETSPNPAPLWI